MERIYESMFLLDNQAVREDWSSAKEIVTGTIEKNGGKVLTARHWDERKLAYPIKRRNRATYLLSYCEVPESGIASLRRDLELNEQVLRYLMLRAEEVPEDERELSAKEQGEDFTLPTPPEDDHDETPAEEPTGREGRPRDGEKKTEEGADEGATEGATEGAKAEATDEAAAATAETTETPAAETTPEAAEPKPEAAEPKPEAAEPKKEES